MGVSLCKPDLVESECGPICYYGIGADVSFAVDFSVGCNDVLTEGQGVVLCAALVCAWGRGEDPRWG
jgi:hypothetical protein